MPASRDPSLLLALDIGTSSVRTVLFDRNLQRVRGSLAQSSYDLAHSADGGAEMNSADLLRGLLECLDRTLSKAGRRQVAAVGVACFWHSLLGVDSRGRPLTPIYTWADSRCKDDAARLRAEMREADYHRRTGCMLRASYWPAKLRWLARTRRGVFRRVVRWQSPSDWLQAQFCQEGGGQTAHGMATGTGLYDPNALGWDANLLSVCGVEAGQLPAITTAPLELQTAFVRRYPALAGARWWPAIGDGAASNLGSGATRPGVAAINVGTSAALRVVRTGGEARAPFGLFCYRIDPRRCLIGGAVSNAGNLRAWCLRELKLPDEAKALDRALAERPGPSGQLVVLPFWSAERAPTWCEDLGGVVQGLTHGTTALDLLQATTEGVYHRLALIADLIAGDSGSGKTDADLTILVSGGVLKSAGLTQRLADVLGRPVYRCAEPEASVRGAALYAAEMEGWRSPEDSEPLAEGRAIRPRATPARGYARERQRQQTLEKQLTESS